MDGECAQAICEGEKLSDLDGDFTLAGTITDNTFTGDMNGAVEGTYSDADFTGDYTADVNMELDGAFFEDDGGLVAAAAVGGFSDYILVDDETGVAHSGKSTLEGGMVVAE